MKFRLPPDCLGVSHAGEALVSTAGGTIEAHETAASALAAHGIERVEDIVADPPPPRGKSRQAKTS